MEKLNTTNYKRDVKYEKTGKYIFDNQWQSFRTKKDKKLELTTTTHTYEKDSKKKKIAVKVVDILGYDTTIIKEVEL